MRQDQNGYQDPVVAFDAGKLLVSAGRSIISMGSVIGRFLRHSPLTVAGLVVGVTIGYALAPFFRPDVYMASAIFEMMPSPMRLVLEPLTQDNTVVGRAMEKEREDDAREKEEFNSGMKKPNQQKEGGYQDRQDSARKEAEQKATLLTYKTLIRSPQVREAVRQKLVRKGIKEIASFAKVEHVDPTNLIEIYTTHPDPYIAYETANTWATTVIEFLTDLNSQQFLQGKSFFWTQYNKSKKEISELEAKITELKRNSQYELKSTELAAKNELLLAFIKDLESTKASVSATEATLPAIRDLADKEEQLEASLLALSTGEGRARMEAKLLKKMEKKPEDAAIITKVMADLRGMTDAINPTYTKLNKQVKDATISLATEKPRSEMLQGFVDRLSREVTDLQVQINEYRANMASLEKDLEIARKQNEMIFSKVSEAELVSAMRFADLRLVSSSTLPESKAPAPTKRFLVVGASIGAFFGFLFSYLLLDRIRGVPAMPIMPQHTSYRSRTLQDVEAERQESASSRL